MDCISLALAVTLHLGLAGDYNPIHPHARCDVNKIGRASCRERV